MLTIKEIQEKAKWLREQSEKNRALMPEYVPLADGMAVGDEGDWATLAREFMSCIDEVVVEYGRLASDYINFKMRVEERLRSLNEVTVGDCLKIEEQQSIARYAFMRNMRSTINYLGVEESREKKAIDGCTGVKGPQCPGAVAETIEELELGTGKKKQEGDASCTTRY